MSSLPPEDQNTPGSTGPDPAAAPQAPEQPQAPAAPEQPQYQAPQQPAQPQHQAPQQPAQPQQPQYQAPAGGQAPPPGGYQQPGYQQPVADSAASTITLNYWLSVFFVWIPALIFYFIEKEKGNALANEFHRANLNFSLVRTGLYVAIFIFSFIPYLGAVVALLGWVAGVVLFIFHIMAAVKAPEAYRRGDANKIFIFNIDMVK